MMCKWHPSWRFGYQASVAWFPKFYFSGRRGIKSDLDFILKYLSCLTEEEQREASSEYERIFMHHTNRGEYREARYNANSFLQNFARERHAEPKQESDFDNPYQKQLERCMEAQKQMKPRIDLGD